jgi:hypothetical protein
MRGGTTAGVSGAVETGVTLAGGESAAAEWMMLETPIAGAALRREPVDRVRLGSLALPWRPWPCGRRDVPAEAPAPTLPPAAAGDA